MKLVSVKGTYVVFATGKYMKDNIKYIDALYKVVAFSDNAPQKWNLQPLNDGRLCVPPSNLSRMQITAVIIATQDMQKSLEIQEQLSKLGIPSIYAENVIERCIRTWDQLQLESIGAEKDSPLLENKITRYVECYVNRQACNLRCSYCYVSQHEEIASKIIPLSHSPAYIARALSAKRLGGRCLISICADGEPLISSDMVELIGQLLGQGHYVYVVSNGTMEKALEQLEQLPLELLSRLFIRFSFHYFELKRRHLLERYFENIRRFHEAGGSFTVFLVGSEEYTDIIENIKELCVQQLGALPHVDYVRDETDKTDSSLKFLTHRNKAAYRQIWEAFDSNFLQCREQLDKVPGGICDAGRKVIHLDLMSGDLFRCPRGRKIDNVYENLEREIAFLDAAEACPLPFCICAPVFYSFGLRADHTDVPTFYELWDRQTVHGTHWIHDTAKEFFSSKFD